MKETLSYGIKWNGISQAATQGSIIIGSIVLARLLPPEDFGLVAMATILSSFALMFLDVGLSQALIQKKEFNQAQASSVFWLNNGVGLLFGIGFFFSAPLISHYYQQQDIELIVELISVTFLFGALPQIPRVILTRQLEFKKMAIVQLIAIPGSYLAGIVSALMGLGKWSIVIQILVSHILLVSGYWVAAAWRPMFHFGLRDIRPLVGYGVPLFLNGLMEYWAQNISGLLIGKSLGAGDMGIYTRSRTFILLPVNNITSVLNRTLFPRIAALQDDHHQILPIYEKTARLQAFFIIPTMAGLAFSAQPFILSFLGSKWLGMVPVLQVFCYISILSTTFSMNDSILGAIGKTKAMFYLGVLEKLILIGSAFIGLKFGLMGVVYANFVSALVVLPLKYQLFNRSLGYSFVRHWTNYQSIILKTLLMIGVLSMLNYFIVITSPFALLLFYAFTGACLYLIINLILPDAVVMPLIKHRILKKNT